MPTSAPILFILKVDSTIRLCINYRGLNKIIVKNYYFLPLVSKMLDHLSYVKIFIKLNLYNIYYRLYIKLSNEWKTVFKTRYSYFKYLIIPFSLTNALLIFQAYIYKALRDLVNTICVIYLDDILIYFKNKQEHIKYIK